MADGSDDPYQIDQLTRLVERGWWSHVRPATCVRSAGGRTLDQGAISRLAACRCTSSQGRDP